MRTPKYTDTPHPYPHFAAELLKIGDSIAVARALGVSQRSAYDYLRGAGLPKVAVVKSHPALDEALTLDFAKKPAKRAKRVQEIAENMS